MIEDRFLYLFTGRRLCDGQWISAIGRDIDHGERGDLQFMARFAFSPRRISYRVIVENVNRPCSAK